MLYTYKYKLRQGGLFGHILYTYNGRGPMTIDDSGNNGMTKKSHQ